MTATGTERIERADEGDELCLDVLFAWLERMPLPEGYKAEIVEGAIYMSPKRDTHWEVILDIVEQLRTKYPRERVKSDVRIDFPGQLNGFASDVVALEKGAAKGANGLWRYQDVEFVAEITADELRAPDSSPKKAAYARAGVPVYLIVEPHTGRWHLHTDPDGDTYTRRTSREFGSEADLSDTAVGLVLRTDAFPRD